MHNYYVNQSENSTCINTYEKQTETDKESNRHNECKHKIIQTGDEN